MQLFQMTQLNHSREERRFSLKQIECWYMVGYMPLLHLHRYGMRRYSAINGIVGCIVDCHLISTFVAKPFITNCLFDALTENDVGSGGLGSWKKVEIFSLPSTEAPSPFLPFLIVSTKRETNDGKYSTVFVERKEEKNGLC